jgi:hypothetical protein
MIEVAADRHATVQLPADFPAGRAWIVVEAQGSPHPADSPDEEDADSPPALSLDMEWWDELGEAGEPEVELARRAGSLALEG